MLRYLCRELRCLGVNQRVDATISWGRKLDPGLDYSASYNGSRYACAAVSGIEMEPLIAQEPRTIRLNALYNTRVRAQRLIDRELAFEHAAIHPELFDVVQIVWRQRLGNAGMPTRRVPDAAKTVGTGRQVRFQSATPCMNSVSPTGFTSSGPPVRYMDTHSPKTVCTTVWPLPVSHSRSSSRQRLCG